jgi:phage-related minor tail protein
MGLMGEAGPEAIMPLKRTATGKLGVQVSGKSNGGNTQNVVTNITINGDVTNDNADVISRQVNEQVRAIIQQELRVQSRPGNQLNRAPSYM